MDRPTGNAHNALAVLLRLALVAALVVAGWSVYRRLPREAAASDRRGRGATTLRVVLSRPTGNDAPLDRLTLYLYPIDVGAAEREYSSERRPGVRFEDFMTRRMGDRQPVTSQFDERGEALVVVAPGRWWLHATLAGPVELSWRLPVNVSGTEKTVELDEDNAYTKAKSF